MPTSYNIFNIQLKDARTGASIITAGGKFTVLTAGTADKATVYDPAPATLGAALANPVTPTRGMLSFATLSTVASVDIAGFAPGGQFFFVKGVTAAGFPSELLIDTGMRDQVALIPYSSADYTANVEGDTGHDLPDSADVSPFVGIRPTVASTAGNTLLAGLLSSESGGDADGFMVAIPTNGAAGTYVAAKSAATATRGALLGGATVDRGHSSDSVTAKSISITLAAAFATGAGFLVIPYRLCDVDV